MKKALSLLMSLLLIFAFYINCAGLTSQNKITPPPVITGAQLQGAALSDSFTVSFTHSLEDAESLRDFICSVALEKYKTEEALRNSPEAYLLSPSKLYLQLSITGEHWHTLKELENDSFSVSVDDILTLTENSQLPENGLMFFARVLLASSNYSDSDASTVYIFTPSEPVTFYITSDRLLLPVGIPLSFSEPTTEDFILPFPEKTGYIFDGWSTENDSRIRLIKKGTQKITLNTHWLARSYEINYHITTRPDMNYSFVGADNLLNPSSYTVGTPQLINPLNTPDVRFVFGGWYYESDFSGEKVTEIKAGETGDKILYAKWISLTEQENEKRFQREQYIKEKKFGDVDDDGKITAGDARAVLRMVVGLDTPDPELLSRADFDGTGTVSALSARTTLRIAVGLDDLYTILLENGRLP